MVVFTIGINRWSLFYPSDGNIAGRDLDLDDTVPINCQQVKRIRAFRWHSNQLLGTESCKSSDKVATIKWLLFWISLYFWWFAFRSKSEFYIIILFVARRLPLVLSIIITTRTSNYVSVATEITTGIVFFLNRCRLNIVVQVAIGVAFQVTHLYAVGIPFAIWVISGVISGVVNLYRFQIR